MPKKKVKRKVIKKSTKKKRARNYTAKGVTWDLSELYKSIDDPQIEVDMAEALKRAKAFRKKYRGKVAKLEAVELKTLLVEYDAINVLAHKSVVFAYLNFAGDTREPHFGALLQKSEQASSQVANELVFFSLEWLKVAENQAKSLWSHKDLRPYAHYLETARKYAPHRLSEAEEKLLELKANTSSRALERLSEEYQSALQISVILKGKKKLLSLEEAIKLAGHDKDRNIRKKVTQALTKTFQEHSRVLTFIYNYLILDWGLTDKLRRFKTSDYSRHLGNELEPKVVNVLNKTVKQNYKLVQRYYTLKKNVLGLGELYDYDRYAPVQLVKSQKYDFEQARSMVLAAFKKLSPRFAQIGKLAFTERWIDAELRPGKQGGAFNYGPFPQAHPYVLMNYQGNIDSVKTLVHELGHAIHSELSRKQSGLEYHMPITTAEMASTFAEIALFRDMLQQTKEPKARLSLLMGKIEEIFATVFRQIAMYNFELLVHKQRKQGELSTEQLNNIWYKTQVQMFGQSVTLPEDYKWWWIYIPHFKRTPFYVYGYAFGELVVLALVGKYSKEGKKFISQYIKVLEAGGSQAPDKLLKTVGVNINDPKFWQRGLNIIRDMVIEAEKLWLEINK